MGDSRDEVRDVQLVCLRSCGRNWEGYGDTERKGWMPQMLEIFITESDSFDVGVCQE